MKPKCKDCVVCLFRPLWILGSISGNSVMSFTCPHIDPSIKSPKVSKSDVRLIISSIYCLIIIGHAIFSCYELFYLTNDFFKILFLFSEIIFCIGTLNFAMTGTINYKERILELNGITSIIENRRYYGITTFLSSKTTQSFLIKSYLIIGLIVWSGLGFAIYFMESAYQITDSIPLMYYYTGTVFVYNISQTVSIYQSMLACCMHRVLFKTCLNRLRQILTNRLNMKAMSQEQSVGKEISLVAQSEKIALEEELKRLKCLYTSLVYNYRELNRFLYPTILIWCVLWVAMLICGFYMLSITLEYGIDSNTLVQIAGCCSSVLLIVYYMSLAEKVAVVISGTVVTYVLVALQFHSSWTK
ncbi:hypothetical protein ILUMI_05512 [Ignelater luminosus]|uniref:Uncharacterized protein n=1 Tax=Ignelater luminosus TaxID=2038154 RepID=A0A8K0GIL4_IGNLU|nr:hypothetical protein ILUMI_05512 [Ignelater luminosus]